MPEREETQTEWLPYGDNGYRRGRERIVRLADGSYERCTLRPGINAAGTVPISLHATAQEAMEADQSEQKVEHDA